MLLIKDFDIYFMFVQKIYKNNIKYKCQNNKIVWKIHMEFSHISPTELKFILDYISTFELILAIYQKNGANSLIWSRPSRPPYLSGGHFTVDSAMTGQVKSVMKGAILLHYLASSWCMHEWNFFLSVSSCLFSYIISRILMVHLCVIRFIWDWD